MNQRPTSFLLRDKITFSERESRRLRHIQKRQKHHHDILPPEFYGTDETQTEIIPEIVPPLVPPTIVPTPTIIPPTIIPTPTLGPGRTIGPILIPKDKSEPPLGPWMPTYGRVPSLKDLGDPIPRNKTIGGPVEFVNIGDLMEDAASTLSLLGL